MRSFRIFTLGITVFILVLFMGMTASALAAGGTKYIQDNGTGGDCDTIGSWDQYTKTCTLNTDITFADSNGIEIISDGVTLNGNGHTITGSGGFATGGSLSVRNNVTVKNLNIRQFGYGIYLMTSHGNTITGCTLEDNSTGLKMMLSNNNTIYGNSFINNGLQAEAIGGSGNLFNMPAPVGGNYWTNWAAPDSDSDGFVDNPYSFTGGTDNLPLAGPSSCTVGKPSLALEIGQAYWANVAEFQYGTLTVDFVLINTGTDTAFNTDVTGSTNSNGVITNTAMPLPLGNLAGGDSGPFSLKYFVPVGISSFRTSLTAVADDDCGNGYPYP